jgi:hypothetical protein
MASSASNHCMQCMLVSRRTPMRCERIISRSPCRESAASVSASASRPLCRYESIILLGDDAWLLTELSNVVAYACRPSRHEDRRHGYSLPAVLHPSRRPRFRPPGFSVGPPKLPKPRKSSKSWNPKLRNPETRNPKPETRNPKPPKPPKPPLGRRQVSAGFRASTSSAPVAVVG